MNNEDHVEWSKKYVKEKFGDNYAAARRSIAKNAKDADDEFALLEQLGLM